MLRGLEGRLEGDPRKIADVIVQLASSDEVPVRLILGVDAEKRVQQAEAARAREAEKWRHLTVSTFLAIDKTVPDDHCRSEHDVHVAVIALYRHWRGAELTRPASRGFAAVASAFVIIGSVGSLLARLSVLTPMGELITSRLPVIAQNRNNSGKRISTTLHGAIA